MIRLFKSHSAILWLIMLSIIPACESEKREEATLSESLLAMRVGTYLDTLQYDDGNLVNRVTDVRPNNQLGVWFTPPRADACSLVAVQYIFGEAPSPGIDSVLGFINLVPMYKKDGRRLDHPGSQIRSLRFLPETPGTVTGVDLRRSGGPIAVEDSMDFLIGWVSGAIDSVSTFPAGLADSLADYQPERSYLISQGGNGSSVGSFNFASLIVSGTRERRNAQSMTGRLIETAAITSQVQPVIPQRFDLGIRAVFQCETEAPDTANFAAELRWNQRNTDLDLYLIMPTFGDTVYWSNRRTVSGGRLDVDDNDGYGPEKIFHPTVHLTTDSLAQLGVHYYGPGTGRPAGASVVLYLNETRVQTIGPCTLRPQDWWNVADIDLSTGRVFLDSTCNIVPNTTLSSRLK